MGILTASQDSLRYDPLRDEDMKGFDPLSKNQGKRIRTYDKDLGFAVHPEEKEGIESYRTKVNETAAAQQSALDQYRETTEGRLAAADRQAEGLLGQFRNPESQRRVNVSVVGPGGVEATYSINQDWVENQLSGSGVHIVRGENGYEVDVNVGGRVQGKEIHQLLGGAQEESDTADQQITAASQGVDAQREAASNLIGAQREGAAAMYNQQVEQGQARIEATRELWSTFISDNQAAFHAGIQTNNGGIRDLITSGALVATGKVEKNERG